jgi:transposase
VELLTRRFFCPAADCPRRIFTERLPDVVAVHARTTTRLHDAHCEIGFALGGEAGARLAARLAMPTSPDTLLRRVRNTPLPQRPFVRVLGVDDWAFRKGHRYGTILCDLEQRCPVDLLPERSVEALCDWLKDHPEVEIISRDRGDDYIRGATAGAPHAVQVADRWHLLRNLRDALKGTLDRHHAEVGAAAGEATAAAQSQNAANTNTQATPAPASPTPGRRAEQRAHRRARRLRRYEQVHELHRQGLSQRAIAGRLGMHRGTVERFLKADTFPERAARRCPRRANRYADYLRQRWAQGCHNAAHLFEEIKAQGFAGSCYTVRRLLARWRQAEGQPGMSLSGRGTLPKVIERPSTSRVSWLLLKADGEVDADEQVFLQRLRDRCPELQVAGELAREFATMVKERREGVWESWLAKATGPDSSKELRAFAEGLKKDEAAVRAALRLEWSNGQVEGQVNRLKTIKRQMFGRAKFDLLRQRVLRVA